VELAKRKLVFLAKAWRFFGALQLFTDSHFILCFRFIRRDNGVYAAKAPYPVTSGLDKH